MRRLPVYFLLDVSESMIGEPIQKVEEGLRTMIQTLKRDPYALETAFISILVFAGKAKTLVPLTDLMSYYPPRLPIGGGTALGRGLGHLMNEIDQHVVKTTPEKKGDWKPIIYLFTDGVPTDEPDMIIQKWQAQFKDKYNLIAVAFGNGADSNVLKQLTDHVYSFDNTDPEAYQAFFKWITNSIRSQSASIAVGDDTLNLKGDGDTVSQISLEKNAPVRVDDNFAVILGKCQTTENPYLIKYRRISIPSQIQGLNLQQRAYHLVGAFQVGKEYFELTDGNAVSNQKLNTEELIGFPACPSCGNQIGFAMCQCGGIICLKGPGENSCPWCGEVGNYGFGEGGMDVQRTKG